MELDLTSVFIACFASSGLWTLVTTLLMHKLNQKDASNETQRNMQELLLGLGHEKICSLGMEYINRGYVTKEELDDLLKYLYKPYVKNGGNGTGKVIIEKVQQLPVK